MRKAIAMVLVGVVGLVAAGCGAAPSESTESGDQALVLLPPFNEWNCSLIAGVPSSPLGDGVALSLGAAAPAPPDTVYSDFYQAVSTTIGYQPSERYTANYTTQWHSIEMTAMTSAQQSSLETLVSTHPWEASNVACGRTYQWGYSNPGTCIQAGVYWCVFDWQDCEADGRPPSACRNSSRMIMAYDPRGCQGCDQ